MTGAREEHDRPATFFSASAAAREQVVACFERAWQQGARPQIEEHLVGEGEERHPLLVELVHVDLECRLKAGEPARVEEYLQRFPDIAQDDALVLTLIAVEYRLRGRHDLTLGIEGYLGRFPQYRDQLVTMGSRAAAGEDAVGDDSSAADRTTDPQRWVRRMVPSPRVRSQQKRRHLTTLVAIVWKG